MSIRNTGRNWRPKLTILAAVSALSAAGCGPDIQSAAPRPRSSRSGASLNVPQIMRGTISSEAIVIGYSQSNSPGYQPILAQGYGLVVGLDGTGSRDIGPDLRAHMLAEMTRGGIGSAKTRWSQLSPQGMLDSMDTAVVLVQGIIPQAAPKRTRLDIRVMPVSGSSTSSLEGGLLYTTQLYPQLSLGRAQGEGFPLAQAKGPIFINPYVEPGSNARANINLTVGRILNGGIVIKDMPLKLRVINPSHARAGMLVTAINTRFPQERGQSDPTARGESDESINLTVPPSYMKRVDQFVELLLHTTIRQANPDRVALSIRRILESNPTPAIAEDAALRWQALGLRVLPVIREMYDYSEERMRLAALVAGARLDDALAVPHLIDMAKVGQPNSRLQSIRLMERMALNPRIDQTLRELLDDDVANIRIEAYEALAARSDPTITHVPVDEKFVIDIVDSKGPPMVYVTEIGLPRIVLFGSDMIIDQPVLMQTWSNRLMVKGDADDVEIEVYYRPKEADQGYITTVKPDLNEFIHFLGHTSTVDSPLPGLGLSYGQTVGIIHQICSEEFVKADFKAQQDRILAAIISQQQESTLVDRPEFEDLPPTQTLPTSGARPESGSSGPDGDRPITSSGQRLP